LTVPLRRLLGIEDGDVAQEHARRRIVQVEVDAFLHFLRVVRIAHIDGTFLDEAVALELFYSVVSELGRGLAGRAVLW